VNKLPKHRRLPTWLKQGRSSSLSAKEVWVSWLLGLDHLNFATLARPINAYAWGHLSNKCTMECGCAHRDFPSIGEVFSNFYWPWFRPLEKWAESCGSSSGRASHRVCGLTPNSLVTLLALQHGVCLRALTILVTTQKTHLDLSQVLSKRNT